jgi:hypothetical protein
LHRQPRYGAFQRWLRRWLYRLTLLLAAGLGGFVIIAPYAPIPPGQDPGTVLCFLFAQDDLLRKTAVISALGLWMTAVVFFRPRDYDYAWWNGRHPAHLD